MKSAAAFRTISEVSDDLAVPQHVLRFWETKFPQVRPLKRGGGRRYYRPEDVELLRRVSRLLYHEGYTIKGVQRLLREGALKSSRPASTVEPSTLTLSLGFDEPAEPEDIEDEAEFAEEEEGDDEAWQEPPPPPPKRRTMDAEVWAKLEGLLRELVALRALLPRKPE
jgi:DNA-binding transcriptional MerR regulator